MTMKHYFWTMKRRENVVQVRKYLELYHYKDEDRITDHVSMVFERVVALRELPDVMEIHSIDEFMPEEEGEIMATMFA